MEEKRLYNKLKDDFSIYIFIFFLLNNYKKSKTTYTFSRYYSSKYEFISETCLKDRNWNLIEKSASINFDIDFFVVTKKEEEEYNELLLENEKNFFDKYWLKVIDVNIEDLDPEYSSYPPELSWGRSDYQITYIFDIRKEGYKKFIGSIQNRFVRKISKTNYIYTKLLDKLYKIIKEVEDEFWKVELDLKYFKWLKVSDDYLYSALVLLVIDNKINITNLFDNKTYIKIVNVKEEVNIWETLTSEEKNKIRLSETLIYDKEKSLFIGNNKEYSIKHSNDYVNVMKILLENKWEYITYDRFSNLEVCKKYWDREDNKRITDLKHNLYKNIKRNLNLDDSEIDFIITNNGLKIV